MLFPLAVNRPDLHYVWRGASLLAVDHNGGAGTLPLSGFFFRQNRFLRDLQLELNGEPPFRCSLAEVSSHRLELTFVYPEVESGDGGGSGSGAKGRRHGILYRDLNLCLSYIVHPASIEVVLEIRNCWQDDVRLDLGWRLSADYLTTDEAHFEKRRQPNAEVTAEAIENGVRFSQQSEELPFQTQVVGTGARWSYEDGRLQTRLELQRQQIVSLGLEIRAIDFEDPIDQSGEQMREARLDEYRDSVWQLHAPGESPLIELAERAADDLASFAMLEGPADEWLTPAAGVPLYLTMWGRDALTTSWQAGIMDGGLMLHDAVARCARLQGTVVDHERDEEPGRIINQAKLDALSRIGDQTFRRFYADVASPFMFITALGYAFARTGDRVMLKRHWPAALRVLDWAHEYGDRDGDGYIEYLTRSSHGPTHQGWKDSENAVVQADGTQVGPPIAPCEIQGYYYVSLQFMAALAALQGEVGDARNWWREAADLKERFNRDFWMDDEGCIAFGLGPDKQQIRALTSNAGQCLPTGIVSEEHIPRLVRRLFEPDLFSGWGIRTLSTHNPAYNPLDYHLGAVWPVENGSILFGLRRYGLNDRTEQLARALYDLARLWPGGRSPECVGGFARTERAHPGTYPRANTPQAWNQSVIPLLIQCLLGLIPFAPLHLLAVDPILPSWLPQLTVRRFRLAGASVSLRFFRDDDGESHFEILEQEGAIRVVRQAWLESLSMDRWGRIGDLIETVRAH